MASSGACETQSTQMPECWPGGGGPSGPPAAWLNWCSNAADCAKNSAIDAKTTSQFFRADFRAAHSVIEPE
jgi:hypothetical protein